MRCLDLPGDTEVALVERLFSTFVAEAGVDAKKLNKQKQRVCVVCALCDAYKRRRVGHGRLQSART